MKQLLTAFLLLLVLTGWTQEKGNNASSKTKERFSNVDISKYDSSNSNLAYNSTASPEAFEKATAKNNIGSRTFVGLKDIDAGFYIISGVFSNLDNTKKATQKLIQEGFDAGFIRNSNDGLNYVYLGWYVSLDRAIAACNSKMEGGYVAPFWLLRVDQGGNGNEVNPEEDRPYVNLSEDDLDVIGPMVQDEKPSVNRKEAAPKQQLSVEEVTYEMLNPVGKQEEVEENSKDNDRKQSSIGRNVSSNGNSWLKKANEYFDKMWYAEAAALYEKALEKDADMMDLGILQRAGDSHYFNANMERASYWYGKIYDRYKNGMSPNYLFKYSHSLKGTGNYGRAKRLMRIYNRRLKNGSVETGVDINKDGLTLNEEAVDKTLIRGYTASLHNLSVNSQYSEFSPMFFNKDEVVFASARDSGFFRTRRYKWNNQPFLDLYVAKINQESQELKNAIKFSNKINTIYHEASVAFSPDNSTMYFTRNNYGKKLRRSINGISHLKIYVSKKVDGEWTEAEEVPFNNDDYSTGHPALSPDGKKLYFVSDMPGTIGETDIFVVDILDDGSYSQPKNLGPGINTEQKEMFPFINDSKLYFASNGHEGLGGLDVYEVRYEESGFREVVNMGQPINSNQDDFSYIVDEESQKGYFASNRRGGKGSDDLYSFERPVPEEVVKNAISGVVTELLTGDAMPKTLVALLDENNIKLKEMITEDDGSFVFEDLESNTKYTIKTTKTEFFENMVNTETKENEVVKVGVAMKKLKELIVIEDGIKKLKTDMIFFDFDKSYIRKDASLELDKLVAVMTEYKDMVIKIESHTDSRGPDTYNKYLSDNRAKSSRAYLISKGISADRIESAIGYGEERLMNECGNGVGCSREKHKLNRRSEFIIVKM